MHTKIIENQSQFNELIGELRDSSYLSIDTEFDRRTTYFADLSLIQISSDHGIYIIDTLKIKDLIFFKDILLDSSILKILHAPEQDFEIFFHLFKIIPVNFFDTQIAASFCGFRKRIGYGELCKEICNIELNKNLQNTNWLLRPLSESMIDYVSSDVKHLKEIYDHLSYILSQNDKLTEYDIAAQKAFREENYKINPDNELKKINPPRYLSVLEIEIVKNLSVFRNEIAIKQNVPRKYIASNADLIALALSKPQTIKDLKKINLQSKSLYKEKLANQIINIIIGQIE